MMLSRHLPTNTPLALKVIPMFDKTRRAQAMREVHALFDAQCPCLVTLYGAFLRREHEVVLVLEYMDGGSLENVISQVGAIRSERGLAGVAFQVLEALRYMQERKKVVHRDIKPPNVLLNSRGEVKLSDFGIASQLGDSIGAFMFWVKKFRCWLLLIFVASVQPCAAHSLGPSATCRPSVFSEHHIVSRRTFGVSASCCSRLPRECFRTIRCLGRPSTWCRQFSKLQHQHCRLDSFLPSFAGSLEIVFARLRMNERVLGSFSTQLGSSAVASRVSWQLLCWRLFFSTWKTNLCVVLTDAGIDTAVANVREWIESLQ